MIVICCDFLSLVVNLFIYLFVHSFILQSFICSIIHLFIQLFSGHTFICFFSFISLCINSCFLLSYIYPSVYLSIVSSFSHFSTLYHHVFVDSFCSLVYLFIRLFTIHLLLYSCFHLFIRLSICLFLHSVTPLFIYSFVYIKTSVIC